MHDSLLSRSTREQEKDCMNRCCIESTRELEGGKGRRKRKEGRKDLYTRGRRRDAKERAGGGLGSAANNLEQIDHPS